MIINLKTGEKLEFSQMTDEQIVEQLADLEEMYEIARTARDIARSTLISRMEAEGAKLRLTPMAKVRLRKSSRIRDRKLVENLYKICPDELKDKCFKHDLRPLKSGLNELAKLGDDWRHKVDAIYVETNSLNVEWIEQEEPEGQEEKVAVNIADIDDIPF